ncbi:MAG: hypothetical protein ACYSUT_12605, partial [Planctomycetota bacterium]
DTLKEEGKFFDAKQLAEWITTLQPRFAAVWDFHAWNMAYNISVAIPNSQPEERWRWVRNGYELLRDEAIVKNPNNISLYRSLGWIFQHKIGGITDDCHRYYKRELALSMRGLLGEGSPEDFAKLAASPQTLEDILKNPEVAKFIKGLQEADETFLDEGNLINNYLALRQMPGQFKPEAHEVINVFRDTETLETFDVFTKARKLKDEWKFDVDFMIELNAQYGPVDIEDPNSRLPLNWEHPATHAIYWAARGLNVAGRPEEYRVDEKNADRVIFHCLQMLFRTGRIKLYELSDGTYELYRFPDPRMFDSCDKTWLSKIVKYENLEGNPKAVRGGHKNLLEDAVLYFYQDGRDRVARHLYQRLQTEHAVDPSGWPRDEYKQPFLAFVKARWDEELEGLGIKDATQMINNLLQQSFFRYALHDDDAAARQESRANEIFEKYQKEMGEQEQYRLGLDMLERMKYQAFIMFLDNPRFSEDLRKSLVGRLQVEKPELFEKLQQQNIKFMQQLEAQRKQQQQSR